MPGRYDPDTYAPKLDLGRTSALGAPEPQRKRKADPLEDFLRFASSVAPAAGTAIGTGIGAGVGGMAGGVGALPGAGIGGAIGGAAGAGLGGLAGMAADNMERPAEDEENARLDRERERQARAQAALSMLGGVR